MKLKIIFPLLLSLCFIFLNSCSRDTGSIKIGAILPLTGTYASFGLEEQKALIIAENKINSEGGINGKPIKFIFEDSKGDPKNGVTSINKLIDFNSTKIFFVFKSTIIKAVQPIIDKTNSLMFAFAMDAKITERSKNTFRIYPNMEQQTQVMLDYLSKVARKKIAILYIETPATEFIVPNILIPGILEKGHDIVSQVSFSADDRDLKSYIDKIGQSKPDILITLVHHVYIPSIIKSMNDQGLLSKIKILGDLSYTSDFDINSSLLNGTVFVAPTYALLDINEIRKEWFVQTFYKKHNYYPGYDPVFFYDTAILLSDALRKDIRISSIKNYLNSLDRFIGTSGEIRFDKSRNSIVSMGIGIFKNGVRTHL